MIVVALVLALFAAVFAAIGLLGGAWSLPEKYRPRTQWKKDSQTPPSCVQC